ncbi:MAG: DUF1674 domain-containing protein [Pseudomonadota bacterium]
MPVAENTAGADHDEAVEIDPNAPPGAAPGKKLPPAAIRALEEAAERRARAAEEEKQANKKGSKEKGGPKGPEPTRFGDWERKGRAVDFS